jgi:DNA-binding NtrC family response regulator
MKTLNDITILIAEDEIDLLDILKEEFELLGARVFGVTDGVQALKIVQQETVHAILSDVRMPGGDGITFFNNINTLKQKPLFYFYSGFNDISEAEAKSQGARALFKKPFDLEKLIKMMHYDAKTN